MFSNYDCHCYLYNEPLLRRCRNHVNLSTGLTGYSHFWPFLAIIGPFLAIIDHYWPLLATRWSGYSKHSESPLFLFLPFVFQRMFPTPWEKPHMMYGQLLDWVSITHREVGGGVWTSTPTNWTRLNITTDVDACYEPDPANINCFH